MRSVVDFGLMLSEPTRSEEDLLAANPKGPVENKVGPTSR